MTMAVPMAQRDVVPPCFGLEWDPKEPECAGGPDPNYQAADGGHIHPQCGVFARCGARTTALRQAQAHSAPNVVPVSNLVRPPVVTPPPQQQPQVQPYQGPPRNWSEYLQRQSNANYVESQRLAAMQAPRPPAAPPVPVVPTFQHPQQYAQHSPAVRYELNYTMPGYLTTPEVRGQGESLVSVIIREIIRAIFKAVGHTVAHSFDTRPLKDPTQPPK